MSALGDFSVTCLEQRDWVDPSDFAGNDPEWGRLVEKEWAHDPNPRESPTGYPVEGSDADLVPAFARVAG